jgi:hypothetical protein
MSNAAIFSLTTASTAVLMLCPCDRPGGSRYAVVLVTLAVLFGLAAAALVYRRLETMSGITEFLRAVMALAIAGAGIYAEFVVASDVVVLLAQHGPPR